MQHADQRAPYPHAGPAAGSMERPGHRPVNLGVEWGSRREELRTSLRELFTGPRPSREFPGSDPHSPQFEFFEPRLPMRGFAASCVWHAAAVCLLVLPIWGFLPAVHPTLQPPQIEWMRYTTAQDLPSILLPSSPSSSSTRTRSPKLTAAHTLKSPAAVYHPRQAILTLPVRLTHPRQTLIEPEAPAVPPNVAPALPNIVEWASHRPKVRWRISAGASAPHMAPRQYDSAAPRMAYPADDRKLHLLATAPQKLAMPVGVSPGLVQPRRTAADARLVAAPRIEKTDAQRALRGLVVETDRPPLALPVSAPAAKLSKRRRTGAYARSVPAPEIGVAQESAPTLRRLIALSATPVPPAPKVMVPTGNLAARMAMSPEGRNASGAHGTADAATGPVSAHSAMKGSRDLPATIRISDGGLPGRSGALQRAANDRTALEPPTFSRLEAASRAPSAPAQIDMADLNPALPAETIFSGRRVYTMHVSMPNVTSARGSWILNFAQLHSGKDSSAVSRVALSAPVPIVKVDPKYPPELIREHVQGEVVLYAIIRADGSVDTIRVMRSLDPRLDRDAAAALARWKFRPGTRAGVPVDIAAVVHIPFNYQMAER